MDKILPMDVPNPRLNCPSKPRQNLRMLITNDKLKICNDIEYIEGKQKWTYDKSLPFFHSLQIFCAARQLQHNVAIYTKATPHLKRIVHLS